MRSLGWEDLGERVSDGAGDGCVVEAEPACEAGDLAGDMSGRHGGDERSSGAQRADLPFWVAQPPSPLAHLVITRSASGRVRLASIPASAAGPLSARIWAGSEPSGSITVPMSAVKGLSRW